jgi:hypothetical protein
MDTSGSNKQLTASASGLSSAVSSTFTVNPGSAASLAIQTQPPSTATAGIAFSPGTVVRLLDVFGNLVTTDSSTVVTATRNAGTAALQGTTSVTAASGMVSFANLSYSKAETITIDFSSGSLTGTTSGNIHGQSSGGDQADDPDATADYGDRGSGVRAAAAGSN